MKKLILSLMILSVVWAVQAQNSSIDDMFNKYSEKEGFTVVTISGRMFSMFGNEEAEKNAEGAFISKLKSIRILSVEDSTLNLSVNFYTELSKKLDLSGFEELMVVKEGKDMTKFLIKQKGDIISELIVVTGGPGGNSLISIQGDLDMNSLSKISKDIGIQDFENAKKQTE
jgi:hypothetical protein